MLRLEVEWVDSGVARDNGWEPKQVIVEHLDFEPVTSVGWLLFEDEERIILAQTYDEKHQNFYNLHAVWRPAIKKITVLRARKEYDGSHRFEEEERESTVQESDVESGAEVFLGHVAGTSREYVSGPDGRRGSEEY